MSEGRFFSQHPVLFVLLNFFIAAVLVVVILLVVHFSLLSSTHHGEEIEVPDLSGMYIEEAQIVLEANELSYQIVDSTYDSSRKLGTVIQQIPIAGSHVKKHREIYLSINRKQIAKVLVPDVLDISYREARLRIESIGLKVDSIYKESEYKDLVLDILYKDKPIAPKSQLTKGETITLVLGKGKEDGVDDYNVVVPNLIGTPLSIARNIIQSQNLQLGGCISDDGVLDTVQNIYLVYDQEPQPRVATFAGATVSVYVTTDAAKVERMNNQRQQQEAEKEAEEEFF